MFYDTPGLRFCPDQGRDESGQAHQVSPLYLPLVTTLARATGATWCLTCWRERGLPVCFIPPPYQPEVVNAHVPRHRRGWSAVLRVWGWLR